MWKKGWDTSDTSDTIRSRHQRDGPVSKFHACSMCCQESATTRLVKAEARMALDGGSSFTHQMSIGQNDHRHWVIPFATW